MIKNNSEILYLYDAKRCNPNGDLDDENKPRMDKNNKINIVSDVRLKRYIRDYLYNYKGKDVFVTVDAKDAKSKGKQLKEAGKKVTDCIDARLFGAVFAQEGGNDHITGPIQFTIAESLNKVDLQKSKTITSSFSSGEGIGNDFRVVYSFIASSASINSKISENSQMSEEDLKLFQEAMIYAIPLCKTRSKIGQQPRLYMQVITRDNISLKDLREFIYLKEKENIIDINQVKLDITNLLEYLNNNKDKIESIEYWIDSNLNLYYKDNLLSFEDIFKDFKLKKIEY